MSSRTQWMLTVAVTLAAIVVGSGTACTKGKPPSNDAAIATRAQSALNPFKAALKTELASGLAQGPKTAIEVCGARAPALALEHSKDGVRVGRASKKLRSQANGGPSWLAPILDDFAKLPGGSTDHRVVVLPDGRAGYAEPIWVQAPCLTCHGENLAPEVDAELRSRYPADAARGYRQGELRGAFFAELDAPAP